MLLLLGVIERLATNCIEYTHGSFVYEESCFVFDIISRIDDCFAGSCRWWAWWCRGWGDCDQQQCFAIRRFGIIVFSDDCFLSLNESVYWECFSHSPNLTVLLLSASFSLYLKLLLLLRVYEKLGGATCHHKISRWVRSIYVFLLLLANTQFMQKWVGKEIS